MNLKEFAKLSGVVLTDCSSDWGGEFTWYLKDHPNIRNCGYRAEQAALRAWAIETFGENHIKLCKDCLTSR